MASFTPQQIEEFLQEFFDVVGARQYIGARYVPIFGRAGEDTVEWDDTAPYEPLTVVMHLGISYVSRRYVPQGIQITDTDYWVETYRFNAQVEQYRQEVLQFQSQIDRIREDMESDYVPFPDSATYPKYGTLGQVLTTLTGGETKWEDPVTVDAAIAEPLIEAWLDEHPEATTTVQDGSITDVKINASSFIPRSNSSSGITNINTATNAGVYTFTATANVSNLPSDDPGILCVEKSQNDAVSQTYVTYGGNVYQRTLWGSSWTAWARMTTSRKVALFISDFDTATDNATSYRYNASTPHAPTTGQGNAFVFTNGPDNVVQVAVDINGTMYVRRLWGSTWTAWVNMSHDAVLADLSSPGINSDLNTATALMHSYRYAANATNAPSTVEGNVFVYGNGGDNMIQVAVDSASNVFVRRKWGSAWDGWTGVKMSASVYPFDVSPANLSTIPEIGVIGDSFASGEVYVGGSATDIYEQSWPQIIARTKGINVYNYSWGGATTKSFVNSTSGNRGMSYLLSSTKRNLYAIVLGINDDKSAEGVGTSADIGTSADTIYGNYSRIIEEILNYSPHSKIVIVTPANNTSEGYRRLNTALETIASYYSIPIIREYEDPFFRSEYYLNTMVSGHPNPSSYGGMANALTAMLENCMAENTTYFYDVNAYTL